MGKLIFYYGVMGCSKSANALMTKFQYEERGICVWLIKPSLDTRSDEGVTCKLPPADTRLETDNKVSLVKSRVGIQSIATNIYPEDNLKTMFFDHYTEYRQNVIICDEAQFFTEEQIEQLRDISVLYDIPVLCYGLRTDFKSKLFSGSKRLFELADKVYELDSICDCGEHAIINARIDTSGKVVLAGAQIEVGGNERYKPMCWKCWKQNQM